MKICSALAKALLAIPVLACSAAAAAPMIGGCPLLPADNVWNAKVDTLPVHPRSAAWVANVRSGGDGASRPFHMDFGSGLYPELPDPDAAPIGIPFVTVPGTQTKVPVNFTDYGEESDSAPGVPAIESPSGVFKGNYPIPPNAPIEGVGNPANNGDRHVLVVDTTNCILYETGNSFPLNGGTSWDASGGAVYDLNSNALRPLTWTSADAAGLPILPGLVRYEEVAANLIEHALRFTAPQTQGAFIWPARHEASNNPNPDVPPMGARFRLKAGVNINAFSPQAKAIAQAMKTYGIMLADNGSAWFVSGAPNAGWDNDQLHELDVLRGSDFEAVDTSVLMVDPNSGQACSSTADAESDGIPYCVELREGRNPAIKDNDIFAMARLFSMQQYRDFLNREGDAGGITFWTNQINSAANTRGQVVENFFNSAEFQQTVAPVVRLYFAYFLRIPDYPGLQFWINYYKAGNSLDSISNSFAASPEFQSTYGALTNAQYVNLIYQNVLGRAPDQVGFDFWLNQLDTAARTRGQVMLAFSESAEYLGTSYNMVYVTMMYVGMLRRAPEQGGFDFWVNYLGTGNSGLNLINGFLAAPEYRARFLP